MLSDLAAALGQVPERVELLQVGQWHRADLQEADRVLLLLTEGVLEQPSLGVLQDVIAWDAARSQDRIVCIFSTGTAAGWSFGCEAQQQAPTDVQACLNDHEAICYRARDDDGPNRHEFGAMIAQILAKLGAGVLPVSGIAETSAPSSPLRDELALLRREKEEALARLAEQDARVRRLEARLASFEGGAC
jgi:hypothetical protein